MFTKEISGLQLCSEIANQVFDNIIGCKYGNDESLISSLRVLLSDRLSHGTTVKSFLTRCYLTNQSALSKEEFLAQATKRMRILEYADNTDMLEIRYFVANDDSNKEILERLDAYGVSDILNGYESANETKWSQYINRVGVPVRFYLNAEKRNTIVFVGGMTIKRWHIIQSMIPRYLPWYFEEKPITDDEKLFVKSLTERYAPKYEEYCERFAEKFDFRTRFVRNSLDGFENSFLKDRLDQVRAMINDYKRRIKDYEAEIGDLFRRVEESILIESGVLQKMNGDGAESNELMEMFLNSKNLDLCSVDDGNVTFVVRTTISNFDPDQFEVSLSNRRGAFFVDLHKNRRYSEYLTDITDDDIERLLIALFRKETMKLRVCAAYTCKFRDGRVTGRENYPFNQKTLDTHVRNYHIDHYSCLGGYGDEMAEACRNHRYMEAVSLCAASAANMSMHEGTTISFFMEEVFDPKCGKVIELPDGTLMTPIEAMKMLRPEV